ncbi:uncharacterized protein KY384_001613 [Bacidia gigantensis]|uniref:uncharacterized protein n=1 Tax=Bacidia gigantensis TaxID=2732470 RepID=UPI001D04E3DF|nr:uncharacterized protein KY384_001613 [Bacidia gigantensis]KAG8533872.1 hypothetical protein KY384_001613 [Bacidia gigantensis]
MAAQSKLLHAEDPLLSILGPWAHLIRSQYRRNSRSTRLAATLAFIISIVAGAYGGKYWLNKRSAKQAQRKTLLRRNSGLRGKDGSRTVIVPYRDSTAEVKIHPTKPTTFDAHRRLFLNPPRAARLSETVAGEVPPPSIKPGLNIAFIHQFLSLLSIMIPHWNSKESGLLLSQGMFLLLRTYLSLVVTRLDGEIVRDLVAGNGKAFCWGIMKWCGIGGIASYTNAAIKFLQSKVAIAFRTRLTRYIHDLYLNDYHNYYKLLNLDGGIGQGADQFITNDLTLFTASAASLYSSLGKPLVDLFVFNYQLYRSLGPLALTGLLVNYFATATFLRRLSPPFGKLKAIEGRREGDFRGLHARLIANAEEIAFYGGADIEKVYLDKSFKDLETWMEGIYHLKIRYNMLEDFILKYSWSAFGYLVTSLPVFLPEWGGLAGSTRNNASDSSHPSSSGTHRSHARMQQFITNKRLMLSLADAGGRIMYSIKDLSELAGYTSRIYSLISTLHRVHARAYPVPRGTSPELYSLSDVGGTLHRGYDGIRFEDVPIVAPAASCSLSGDELIPSLSFTITPGQHVLVSGPNGAGKSSLARILSGIWPVFRGLVSRPRRIGLDGAFFLPQRPYLPLGTLRDQVIYPHSEMDMRDAGRRDAELQTILEDVRLGYLVEREGGWNTREDWTSVLSGGEKQRISFARILYHEPAYAVVDEGTSAVSSDVEGVLYEKCKDKGVTLLTISTRVSLKKHHYWNLDLGQGEDGTEWVFDRIGTREEEEGVERELEGLRERLAKVQEWKDRKSEIEAELKKVWVRTDGESKTRDLPAPVIVNEG